MFGLSTHTPDLDFWPEQTSITDTDVIVAGVSLLRLAEVCGTPAVHSAAAVVPGADHLACDAASTAVLVARVLSTEEHISGATVVQVDARLDNLRLIWSETRRVGGRPGVHTKLSLVVRKPGARDTLFATDVLAVDLPADLAAGDLLAIPSRSIPVDALALDDAAVPPRHPLTGRPEWAPSPVV